MKRMYEEDTKDKINHCCDWCGMRMGYALVEITDKNDYVISHVICTVCEDILSNNLDDMIENIRNCPPE